MRSRLFVFAVLVVAATACGGGGGAEPPVTPANGPAAPAAAGDVPAVEEESPRGDVAQLEVATSEYAFDLPEQVDGGIVEVTVVNEGAVPHEVAFVKVSADYDAEQFAADFAPILEGGPIPATFENVTGVADVEGGATYTSTVTLPEGDYVVFCALTDPVDGEPAEGDGPPPHYELGMLDRVTVAGGSDVTADAVTGAEAALPAFDYGFEADQLASLGAGTHTVAFSNSSEEQFHHAVVFGFPEGVDEQGAMEAFNAMIQTGEGPPPEGVPEPEEAGYSAVYGPGMGGTFDLTLDADRVYAAVCFIQDRAGGPPHAVAHQMVTFFTVS